MEETSTERFLRLMNERNSRIAADEAPRHESSLDPIREQRQVERRETLGQLRAREHRGRRVRRVQSLLPHVDLSE